MTAIVQHSAKSAEWGTPDCVLEPARTLDEAGRIALDPFTSLSFAARVNARYIITHEAFDVLWPDVPRGLVLVNPPGNRSHEENKPAKAWRKLLEQRELGRIGHAIWVGFTVEHLRHCQPLGLPALAHFPLCFPRERLKFIRPDGTEGRSPGHANVIGYVPGNVDERDKFYAAFESLGACR